MRNEQLDEAYKKLHQKLLDNLITQSNNMLEGGEEAYSVALSGAFGIGKTFFLKEFKKNINNKPKGVKAKAHAVYIDAQSFDYTNSPHETLTVLLEIIIRSLQKNQRITKKIFNVLKKVGLIAIKHYTDEKNIKTIQNTGKEFGIEELENFLAQKDYKNNIKLLQVTVESVWQVNKQPLIIIIDELDRTSPQYALSFLETIRHMLSMQKVIFVFGVNANQMISITKSTYGITEDAEAAAYLSKYFKHIYDLEVWLNKENIDWRKSFYTYFFDKIITPHITEESIRDEFFSYEYQFAICNLFGLSAREMRDVIYLLKENWEFGEIHKERNPFWFYNFVVISFLLCLKTKNPNLLEIIKQKNLDVPTLIEYFEKTFKSVNKSTLSYYEKRNSIDTIYVSIFQLIIYSLSADDDNQKKFFKSVSSIADFHEFEDRVPGYQKKLSKVATKDYLLHNLVPSFSTPRDIIDYKHTNQRLTVHELVDNIF